MTHVVHSRGSLMCVRCADRARGGCGRLAVARRAAASGLQSPRRRAVGVRVLAVTTARAGHVAGLLPLTRARVRAGHEAASPRRPRSPAAAEDTTAARAGEIPER